MKCVGVRRTELTGFCSSRPSLVKAHRQEKPAAAPRKASILKVSLPPPTLLKSELKALKKKKKKGEEEEETFGSDEENAPRKQHKDGELLDDLEEDDLAFGSGDSDDSLSVMSDLSGDEGTMSDMSNMSDLDSLDDGDDDLGSGFDSEEELE